MTLHMLLKLILLFYTVPEQGLHSIMPGAGLRFVEYDYKDADDYTGTVSANVVADMQGVGLAANYNAVFQKPDTDGSGFWDWYRVDIAFHEIEMSGRLLTASPVNADTVRLVFDVPVQFKSGTMTLGNLYQAASAQMENGEDGYSRTWLVRFFRLRPAPTRPMCKRPGNGVSNGLWR